MKKNIGILGATGLVGSSVLSALQGKGYSKIYRESSGRNKTEYS